MVLTMRGDTHTHSSLQTQAFFGPFQGPVWRSLTYHSSVYSDHSQAIHQPRGPNKKRSCGAEKAVYYHGKGRASYGILIQL